MLATISYTPRGACLLSQVDLKARSERNSSGVIVGIIEKHSQTNMRLGEITLDLGAIALPALQEALSLQQSEQEDEQLRDIPVEQEVVGQEEVERALLIQQQVGTCTWAPVCWGISRYR